jgi:undecaprenyl-diphosphatase
VTYDCASVGDTPSPAGDVNGVPMMHPIAPQPADPVFPDPARRAASVAPPSGGAGGRAGRLAAVRTQVQALDQAVFNAVADTATPDLDRYLVRLSSAANYSRLWLLIAAGLAAVGGARGRRAASLGVLAIGAASAVSNLAIKPMARRRRPAHTDGVPFSATRRVRRPASASFPSGHTASAVAFASAVGETAPGTWIPLHVTAALVGYSRVHAGVHHPSDVAAGAMVGALCGWSVRRLAGRALVGSSQRGGRRDRSR